MILDFKAITRAKHIVIVTRNATFANASTLYSYILTLHKKVSLHTTDILDNRLTFLPWFDKARVKIPSSGDLIIEVDSKTQALYMCLIEQNIRINIKMANALYAGLFQEFQAFQSPLCDGTVFALASELIALQADYKKCRKYLLASVPLGSLRLKAELLRTLLLENEATHAKLYVNDAMLEATGTLLGEAYMVMDEVLNLVHVRQVTLYKDDENCKIIKEI